MYEKQEMKIEVYIINHGTFLFRIDLSCSEENTEVVKALSSKLKSRQMIRFWTI